MLQANEVVKNLVLTIPSLFKKCKCSASETIMVHYTSAAVQMWLTFKEKDGLDHMEQSKQVKGRGIVNCMLRCPPSMLIFFFGGEQREGERNEKQNLIFTIFLRDNGLKWITETKSNANDNSLKPSLTKNITYN